MFVAIVAMAAVYVFTGFFISLGFWLRAKFTDRVDASLILRDKAMMERYVKELHRLENAEK